VTGPGRGTGGTGVTGVTGPGPGSGTTGVTDEQVARIPSELPDGVAALRRVAEATERLAGSVAALRDPEARAASGIPPWTRGHVVTHVARAADSYRRLLGGAVSGEPVPQYPSMAWRAEQIEQGAHRPVAELVADLRQASDRFAATLRALPAPAWRARVRMRPGELREPAALPLIRLRELEVHHVDLATGYRFADIEPVVAEWIVDDILMELRRRDPVPPLRLVATDTGLVRELGRGGPRVRGPQPELLAWLSGRSDGSALSGSPDPAPSWI
jgi:maleylpyruvate isomerase